MAIFKLGMKFGCFSVVHLLKWNNSLRNTNIIDLLFLLTDSDETFPLPLKIFADKPGLTSAKLVIQGPDDIRLYRIECVALPGNEKMVLTFTSPLNHPITQPIPIVNKTAYDWELSSQFIGNPIWFTGPSIINVPSNTTVQYSITYLPRREAESQVSYCSFILIL